VSLAFVGPDQRWDQALASNNMYMICLVLVTYWLATFATLRGIKSAAALSKWGGMIGTIIPAAILIVLGALYLLSGKPVHIQFAWSSFIPDFTNFNNLVLAAGIFLFYAGMEMNAIHVKDVDNPTRNYPIAIALSSIITVIIFVLGTLAIAVVIPSGQINLVQSLLVGYDDIFHALGIGFLAPVIALALAFGVLGGVTVWVAGPSAGLAAVGRAGYLPPFFQKMNRNGMAVHILLVQGLIVTFLSIMFVILPSVQAAYQILSQLTVTLYLIMYLLMFAAAIYLRYTQPHTPRPYRVPFGEAGMWIFGGAGLVGSLIAFVLSFVPPSQIATGSPTSYVLFLIGGNALFVVIPLLIYAARKPHWKTPEGTAEFEPFTWEKEGRLPGVPQSLAAVRSATPSAAGAAE
jgi:putative glutamate/gamma-aminobutyrate antiporter